MSNKSILSSKAGSGISTPRKDVEEVGSEYNSPLFSVQLQERLRQLDLNPTNSGGADGGNGGKPHGFSRNGLAHAIEVLSEDRRKTSELAREQALGTLLRHLVMKYDPGVIHYELFATIVQAVQTARTEVECITALQLVCVCATLVEESDDARSGDSLDLVVQLQQSLLKRVEGTDNVNIKQALITTYAVLTYFLNAGGGGYGMEAAVNKLMEIAESTSGPENAPVATAALNGATVLTTLTSKGSAGEIAQDWLFSLTPMLEVPQLAPRLATVKFIAVLFEITDPEILKSGDMEEACEDIISTMESLSQESISRTAKRDKKTQNLLLKSVLRSCRHILEGGDVLNGDGEEGQVSELVSHYHKQTVSKSVGITTWAALSVVEHLGWVFGPGLHNHLANNPYVKSLLAKEDVKVESSGPIEDDDTAESSGNQHAVHESPLYRADAAKRAKEIRKQQLEKVERQGRIDP